LEFLHTVACTFFSYLFPSIAYLFAVKPPRVVRSVEIFSDVDTVLSIIQ